MSLLKLHEVKRKVQITTDDYDSLLLDLIEDVSAIIESYCGRNFTAADYTEYQDGTGKDYFFTDEWPINTITSIYDDPDRLFASDSLVDSTYYTFYANEGKVSLIYSDAIISVNLRSLFSVGVRNIRIIYNAGYTTIPSDLKMIASEILIKKFKNIQDKRIGLTSISSAGENFSFHLNDMLPEHKMILDAKYRYRGIQ